MAKGNVFLATLKGSVGDTTFSVLNGQQILKKKAVSTRDARSPQQMLQRARFSCAVSFFTRGTKNLFRFAYQMKGQTLSDYNAFMRVNTKNAMYFTPEMNETPAYPALGKYMMSKGELKAITASQGDGAIVFNLGQSTKKTRKDMLSVAELSEVLIYSQDWHEGDILTILRIKTNYKSGTVLNPVDIGSSSDEPVWDIQQLVISTSSVDMLTNHNLVAKVDVNGNVTLEMFNSKTVIEGYAAIHSRKTPKQLKVSTSYITFNAEAEKAWDLAETSVYRDFVIKAWNAGVQSILEGSISSGEIYKTEARSGSFAGYIPANFVMSAEDIYFGTYTPKGNFYPEYLNFELYTDNGKGRMKYVGDDTQNSKIALYRCDTLGDDDKKFIVKVDKNNGKCYLKPIFATSTNVTPQVSAVMLGVFI